MAERSESSEGSEVRPCEWPSLDWSRIGAEIALEGFARIPDLLAQAQCFELAALFDDEQRFRATIDMARYRFGEGEYRYFSYPLPRVVAELRASLYPPLAEIANEWQAKRGSKRGVDQRYPDTLQSFLEGCHEAGQTRPTPLLLRYTAGGYNCLHQDRYGDIFFPFQITCLLSRPGEDFEGGEFLLVEQRPRMQSRGEAVSLEAGEGIIFPNTERPVLGKRGYYRSQYRHGVSRIRSGERIALGIIFHDAE